MANIVYMARSAWTGLLDTIRSKAGITGSMTVSQAASAVESIETGGGGDEYKELVERTISVASGNMSMIGEYAFAVCNALRNASFPMATTIGKNAFANCVFLSSALFPTVKDIGSYAFSGCMRLSMISFPLAETINYGAFSGCSSLTSVDFPLVTSIGGEAFRTCFKMTTVEFLNATSIGATAFGSCYSLTTTSFPNVQFISTSAFANCRELSAISLPALKELRSNAFEKCYNLLSLYILGSEVVSLFSSNAFSSTPISTYTTSTGGVRGTIFVPASLYDQYISASNWSIYSSRIVSVAD